MRERLSKEFRQRWTGCSWWSIAFFLNVLACRCSLLLDFWSRIVWSHVCLCSCWLNWKRDAVEMQLSREEFPSSLVHKITLCQWRTHSSREWHTSKEQIKWDKRQSCLSPKQKFNERMSLQMRCSITEMTKRRQKQTLFFPKWLRSFWWHFAASLLSLS